MPLALLLVPVGGIVAKSWRIGSACASLQGPLDVRFVHYVLEWGYLHLHGATAPDASLWSPPFYFPVPRILAYSENLFAGYLFYFPLRWLGLMASQAVFGFRLIQLALTPIVAYFCLRALRRSRATAFVGAAVFSWGWIRFFHYGHIQFSAGYPIPLFLTALYFAVHRRRPWALVLAAWTFLFVWHLSVYTAVFLVLTTLMLGAAWLVLPGGFREILGVLRFYGRRMKTSPRQMVTVLLLCGVAVALVVPSAQVYREVQSELKAGSEAELRLYWGDLYSWVRPPRKHPVLGSLRSVFPKVTGGINEKQVFLGGVGLLALVLPGLGLLWKGRRIFSIWPRSLVAVAGAGTAIILVFSSYGGRWPELPFLLLQQHFPGLAGMRAPTRIAFIVAWLVVLCACFLLDRWGRRLRSRWLAVGLGILLLVENLAPLPRVVNRCRGEAIWQETARNLCSEVPRDEVGTLLFLPTDIHSIRRVLQQGLAMQMAQVCNLNLVNGYTGRRPPLMEPLFNSPARVFPCRSIQGIADRVHEASHKGLLIHFDHGPPLGPAGYPDSAIGECLAACLAPEEPKWFVEQSGRPATVFVTDPSKNCAAVRKP